jgi:preprotein translocase subunit SecE
MGMRVSALQPELFAWNPIMSKTNPVQFMQQVRAEVSKVSWPARREVVLTTVMVFIMAALTATFFSLVDIGIRFGLTAIVGGF